MVSKNSTYIIDATVFMGFYVVLFFILFNSTNLDVTLFHIAFFLVPVFYLIIRELKKVPTLLKVSIPIGIMFSFIIILGPLVGAWLIDLSYQINFLIVLRQIIFSIIWVLFGILVYEHFIRRQIRPIYLKRNLTQKFLIIALLLLSSVTFVRIFLDSNPFLAFVRNDFSYLKLVAPFLLFPIIIVVFKFSEQIKYLLSLTLFTFPINLAHILLGFVHFGNWQYTGKYILMLNIFDNFIPVEDIFFWALLGHVSVVSWYIILTTNRKGKINKSNTN